MYKPVAYGSKANSDAVKRYKTFKGETFALTWALDHVKHFIMGRHILVEVDNDGLAQATSNESFVIQRWLSFIHSHPITIRHIPGKQNIVADVFSRVAGQGDALEGGDGLDGNAEIAKFAKLCNIVTLDDITTSDQAVNNLAHIVRREDEQHDAARR